MARVTGGDPVICFVSHSQLKKLPTVFINDIPYSRYEVESQRTRSSS